MLAVISAFDETAKECPKDKVGFIHLAAKDEESIKVEASPIALSFARKNNLKKVYLLYGEKGKIIYEYD